jgi:hypothetical protein
MSFRITILRGVTVPHKVTTAGLVDELSTTAEIAGACNAILRLQEGTLLGDMFDGAGFCAAGAIGPLDCRGEGGSLRVRMLAIAFGYEDADDLDHLRSDLGFKLACGRLPDTGRDPCSQPTMSRWEMRAITPDPKRGLKRQGKLRPQLREHSKRQDGE